MHEVYLVTRPDGTKTVYDFSRRLEKEEGFRKGLIKDTETFPIKMGGFLIEKIPHDSRI